MSGGEIYVRLKLGMNGRLDLYSPKQPQSLQTGRLISAIGLFCYFVSSESGGRKKSGWRLDSVFSTSKKQIPLMLVSKSCFSNAFSSSASCNNMQINLWQQQHKSKARLSRACEDSVHSRRCKRVQDISQRFAKYFWIRPWFAEYVWIMDGPWFVKYIHYTYRPDPALQDI